MTGNADLEYSSELWNELIGAFETARLSLETLATTAAPSVASDDAVALHHVELVVGQEATLLTNALTAFTDAKQGTQEAYSCLCEADSAGAIT